MALNKRTQKMSFCFLTALMLILLFVNTTVAEMIAFDSVDVFAAPLTRDVNATNGMVRVYLSSLGNPSTLHLTTKGNYSVNGTFLPSGTDLTVQFNASTGKITLSYDGQKWDMGRSFSLRRHSAAGANGILIAEARESSNPYPGDLSFKAVAGGSGYTLYPVAHIYIENYLYGVLPYEMGNSSNIEALKAQAVAARTYTVRMMKSRESGLYDVKDTTSDQVYRGTPSGNANCVAAVDATKGIVLMYGSSYITTYYSASNGGQTETSRSGSSFAYMKVKDDPFDYANPNSTVKSKTIYANLSSASNPSQLVSLLKNKAIVKLNQLGYRADSSNTTLKTLKSITPHTPKYASPSRLYTKMDFSIVMSTQNASGQTVTVTQSVTCDIFSELESMLGLGIQSSENELWSVEKGDNQFKIQARRYGHGMGMSQRGAMYMGKLGYDYAQILGFYYDGCKRVQHSFTNTILSADSSDEQTVIEDPADMTDDDSDACRGTVKLASSGSALAIRSEKSNSSRMIGTAGNGAIVDVLSNDGSWCMIRFGQLYGYVPASALVISGTPSHEEAEVTRIAGFATVTASDFVNLRAEASMNGKILGTAPAGAVLTVFEKSGSWARVQHHSLVAYVNTGFISAVTQTYPSDSLSTGSTHAYVDSEDGHAPLRKTPSMSSHVLMELTNGIVVTILSDDGSWSEVICEGVNGYVLSAQLQLTDEDPPASEEEEETDDNDQLPEDEDEETDDKEEMEDETGLTAVVTTEYGSLNMRAEARAGSFILTTIPRGMQIRVLERGIQWSLVQYAGYAGYVMNDFLTFEQGEEPDEDEEMDSVQEATAAMVVTPSGTLNMRAEPRTGSTILTRIQPFETVTVHERGSEWCMISYRGMTGYVMTVFLSFDVYAQPDVDGPEDPDTEELVTAMVTTSSGSLNMRMSPSRDAKVLLTIPRFATVQVLYHGNDWCQVSYQSQLGYVMTEFLTFHASGPSVPETDDEEDEGEKEVLYAIVATGSGSLNLREYPASGQRVLTTIPRGTRIAVTDYSSDWCAVRYAGWEGYVMTSFLRFETIDHTPDDDETDGDTGDYDEYTAVTVWVNVASGSLNMRQAPDGNAQIIATIPRASQVKLLEEGTVWSFVCYAQQYGYVKTEYLSVDKPVELPAVQQPDDSEPEDEIVQSGEMVLDVTLEMPPEALFAVNATNDRIKLWPMCAETGSAVGRIGPGEMVEIILQGKTWCLVAYDDIQGYCYTHLLSVMEE